MCVVAILLKEHLNRTKFNNSEVENLFFILVQLSPKVTDRAIGSENEDLSQTVCSPLGMLSTSLQTEGDCLLPTLKPNQHLPLCFNLCPHCQRNAAAEQIKAERLQESCGILKCYINTSISLSPLKKSGEEERVSGSYVRERLYFIVFFLNAKVITFYCWLSFFF